MKLYKTKEDKTMGFVFDAIFNSLDMAKELIAYAADAATNLVDFLVAFFSGFPMPL